MFLPRKTKWSNSKQVEPEVPVSTKADSSFMNLPFSAVLVTAQNTQSNLGRYDQSESEKKDSKSKLCQTEANPTRATELTRTANSVY